MLHSQCKHFITDITCLCCRCVRYNLSPHFNNLLLTSNHIWPPYTYNMACTSMWTITECTFVILVTLQKSWPKRVGVAPALPRSSDKNIYLVTSFTTSSCNRAYIKAFRLNYSPIQFPRLGHRIEVRVLKVRYRLVSLHFTWAARLVAALLWLTMLFQWWNVDYVMFALMILHLWSSAATTKVALENALYISTHIAHWAMYIL